MVPLADGSDTVARCATRGLLQRRGLASVTRTCAASRDVLVAVVRLWTHGALGCRPGAVSERHCRARQQPARHSRRRRAFRPPLGRSFKNTRVAWWRGLGGIPFEPEIRTAINANRRIFENLGCIVEEAEPDFTGVDDAFPTLRYVANHVQYSALIRERADWVKDTIKFEVAEAERMTAVDVGRAWARQARIFRESREFFERYDYFVLPVTQVSPFDVETPYPTKIGDVAMANYIDWMQSCWYVTFMATPAISVPAGFTPGGLPVESNRRPPSRRLGCPAARIRLRAGDPAWQPASDDDLRCTMRLLLVP